MSTYISIAVLFLAPLLSALPEEPLWSQLFCALLTIACAAQLFRLRESSKLPKIAGPVLLTGACAVVSLLVHWLITYHAQPVYLDVMLKGTVFWVTAVSSFLIAAIDRRKVAIYGRTIATIAGAAVAAGIGLQDYLLHLRHGEGQWREFGTSTPDFYAGQLVMTVPTALAMFIGAKGGKGRIFWLLYIFALILQTAVIPTTGSRFALVSLAVGTLVFIVTASIARAHGMEFGRGPRIRVIALVAIALVGGVVVAKPLLSRLQSGTLKSQEHSGDFREWTWRGTAKLIESSPIIGAGPGMFVYSYPKRAIVGFTRHAHDAYLQTAGDIGVPALLLLLAAFAVISRSGIKSLSSPPQELAPVGRVQGSGRVKAPAKVDHAADLEDQVYLVDDRFLLCGLLGSIAASLSQNIVDSDWFTFAGGIVLMSLLGTVVALAQTGSSWRHARQSAVATAATMLAAGLFAAGFFVAEDENQNGNILAAERVDPLSSTYVGDAAMKVYLPGHDLSNTEASLIQSCMLAPDSTGYHRLGSFYLQEGNFPKAETAWTNGLDYDPHSLALLTSLGDLTLREGRTGDALRYYQAVADLETTPYGTVRAIPEVSETRFADADGIVADAFFADHRYADSIPYYLRVKADCEEYSADGGAANGMRIAAHGNVIDTELDSHMRALYIHSMNNLALAYADDGDAEKASEIRAHFGEELKTFPGT